ncbi:MAG: recombinase family protein [Actinomycetota bacterium]
MTPKGKGSAAAGYLRVSKERDGMEAPSIYRQQIRDYCAAYDYRLTRIFEDIDFSGRKGAKPRPGFTEMMQQRQSFDIIIVPSLSRFGRSMKDNLTAYDELEKDGVALAFLDLRVDTSTSSGKLVRNLMSGFAEFESDQISDRWKAALRHVAQQGRHNSGSNVPLGLRYDRDHKNLVHDAATVGFAQEVFERYDAGENRHTILRDFIRRGVPRPKGGQWYTSTLTDMLAHPFYVGEIHHDGEVYEAGWEPVVPRELFDRVQLRLRGEQATTKRFSGRKGRARYLLSGGLLLCGKCGASMVHHPGVAESTRHPATYRCPASELGRCDGGGIAAHRIEADVVSRFFEHVQGPVAEGAKKMGRSALSRRKKAGPDYDKQLAKVDAEMDRLIEMSLTASGPGAQSAFERRMDKLEQQRKDIQSARAEAGAEGVREQRRIEDLEKLRAVVSDIERLWAEASLEQRQALLRLAIDKVETVPHTRPKQHRITWAEWSV